MGNKITHVRVIYRPLRLAFPSIERRFIVGEHPNDMDIVNIFEGVLCWVDEFTAENKVEALGHRAPLGLKYVRLTLGCAVHGVKWIRANHLNKGLDEPMMNAARGDHSVDLWMRVVKYRRRAALVRYQTASFGDKKTARRDIPFPRWAKG